MVYQNIGLRLQYRATTQTGPFRRRSAYQSGHACYYEPKCENRSIKSDRGALRTVLGQYMPRKPSSKELKWLCKRIATAVDPTCPGHKQLFSPSGEKAP